jgi:hypothetical protein
MSLNDLLKKLDKDKNSNRPIKYRKKVGGRKKKIETVEDLLQVAIIPKTETALIKAQKPRPASDLTPKESSLIPRKQREFKVHAVKFLHQGRTQRLRKGDVWFNKGDDLVFTAYGPFQAARKAWTKVCKKFYGDDEQELCRGLISMVELGKDPPVYKRYKAIRVPAAARAHRRKREGGKIKFKWENRLKSIDNPKSKKDTF